MTQFVLAGSATVYLAGQTAAIAGIGALTIEANGDYTFTPAANFSGPVPVATYTVTDGSSPDDTSTLTITVTPVGDAFADANESVETAEDEELTGNVLIGTSSPDGAVSVTQFVLAGSATVYLAGQTAAIAGIGALTIAANGDYTFTPAANYSGPVPVATYTVTDGSSPDDTSTLTIAVTPVGDAFADANESVETAEDEELTGNVLIGTSSPDGAVSVTQFVLAGSATVYLAGQTAAIAGIGALTIAANGDYTFTPAANYSGPVPVATYTVTDGSSPDDTSTLTIAVTPVGDAFADANESVETAEDEELTGNVLIGTSSPDGAVSVTQFVLAGSATVYLAGQTAAIAGIGALTIAANGDYTFTPAANYSGPVPVATYTVTDGSSPDDTSTLTIAVTPVGDAFADANESVETAEDEELTGNVLIGTSTPMVRSL